MAGWQLGCQPSIRTKHKIRKALCDQAASWQGAKHALIEEKSPSGAVLLPWKSCFELYLRLAKFRAVHNGVREPHIAQFLARRSLSGLDSCLKGIMRPNYGFKFKGVLAVARSRALRASSERPACSYRSARYIQSSERSGVSRTVSS